MTSDAATRVVVTGANEGIGYHLSSALVDDGYLVAGLDVDVTNFRAPADANPGRVRYLECDVRSDDNVEEAIGAGYDEWDLVDVLVNNAAVLNFGFVEVQTLADVRETFEINYFGYLRPPPPYCLACASAVRASSTP